MTDKVFMNDQADTLRRMASAPSLSLHAPLGGARHRAEDSAQPGTAARTIAVTGGKGGVGKSNVAVNLSLALVARGRNVSLLDADLGLANADVLLGLNPHLHIGHALSGRCSLGEVMLKTDSGLRLIPGGSGVEELTNLSQEQHRQLVEDLQKVEGESDYLIVDTAAGIANNVTGVLRAASEIVVVTTPDPTAVVDAYALIKVLHRRAPGKLVRVVVNDVVGIGDAERTFAQIDAAARRFLQQPIEHLGTIPRDDELVAAVREQVPVIEYAPESPSSRAFRLIAKHLERGARAESSASFWGRLLAEDI